MNGETNYLSTSLDFLLFGMFLTERVDFSFDYLFLQREGSRAADERVFAVHSHHSQWFARVLVALVKELVASDSTRLGMFVRIVQG